MLARCPFHDAGWPMHSTSLPAALHRTSMLHLGIDHAPVLACSVAVAEGVKQAAVDTAAYVRDTAASAGRVGQGPFAFAG